MILKPRTFILLKDATNPPKPVPKGTIIYEFQGSDWGLVADDWRMGGVRSRAMTLDPDGLAGPFFTVRIEDMEEVHLG